jgi:cyclopropane fatty-acyl-phospholipid synthase-like methyltransferase
MGEVVRAGYDALGPRFGAWAARIGDPTRDRLTTELAARLPQGARVLDLGCGSGALARLLADQFEVVGVDISSEQLTLAREAVPRATFVEADLTTLEVDEASFDGVCALYSITHVPREEHASLFARIAGWLRPGGLFLASLSSRGSEDWRGEWLGVEMFFSGHAAETNRRLLRESGFELLVDEIATIEEPEGPAEFLWVLARKGARNS